MTGQNNVGFAVVSTQKPLAWASLPPDCSAPAAALAALTEACKLGKNVTIYIGSRYTFGLVHDFDALREISQMGFRAILSPRPSRRPPRCHSAAQISGGVFDWSPH